MALWNSNCLEYHKGYPMTEAPATPALLPEGIRRELDEAISELKAGERTWSSLPLVARAALLQEVQRLTVAHGQDWVDAAVVIKKLDPTSPLVGEEWISGPYPVATSAATLAHTLAALASGVSPLDELSFKSAPGGRTSVSIFPTSIWDRLLLSGFSASVWLEPDVTPAQAKARAGLGQLRPRTTTGVGLVLGAGNITSIAPLDVLHEVVANNRPAILKLHPIAAPLKGVFDKVLQPLVDVGVVRIVEGEVEVGEYLTHHADIAHVHITGSAASHDAIVYGADQHAADRQTRLEKPVTSELGGVSPVIVIPDRWSAADVKYQAEHVATQRLHNAGYNCVATQVVILPRSWKHKTDFLAALEEAMAAAPARSSYYPGGADRLESAARDYPSATRLGRSGERLLTEPLDGSDDAALKSITTTEFFAPVLGIVELDGEGTTYLDRAADFANTQLTGTLGANVLAHPRVIKRLGRRFDEFLASLRYGTVAVNAWTGVGFLTATATFGAFPGHTYDDIQSGIGTVHNALLIDNAERTVVRGPFRPIQRSLVTGQWSISPKPVWFVSNRTAATTGRLLVRFVGRPSFAKLPRLFASALRG